MTYVITNKLKTSIVGIPGIKSISFDFLDHKVYSAQKIQSMCGYFVSQPIDSGVNLISWKEMIWDAIKLNGTDIAIYLKTSSSESNLENVTWNGPYYNYTTDLSDFKDRYLQFMIALCNNGAKNDYHNYFSSPIFKSISLVYSSSSNASKFYSKAFNLNFVPKHILLTYNGEISSDSIVRFAVSGFDSVDPNDYQYIEANKIVELEDFSILSNKIKLLIEMLGDSNIPVVISEVALMFSGDQQLRLNNISSSSSEESSSSSDL